MLGCGAAPRRRWEPNTCPLLLHPKLLPVEGFCCPRELLVGMGSKGGGGNPSVGLAYGKCMEWGLLEAGEADRAQLFHSDRDFCSQA